jgi:hypothetical protein
MCPFVSVRLVQTPAIVRGNEMEDQSIPISTYEYDGSGQLHALMGSIVHYINSQLGYFGPITMRVLALICHT